MFSFVQLLRTVFLFTRNGQLDSVSALNALLSKEPYHELSKLLLNKSLQSPNNVNVYLVHQLTANILNYQNAHGWALIHFAAYEKNYKLMKICIKNHANLMICDNNGNTVLHIAIQVAQKNNKTTRCAEGGNDVNNLTIIEKDKKEQQYLKVIKIVKLILTANSNSSVNDEDETMFNLNETNCETNSNYQTIDRLTDQQTNLVNKQNVFGKTALHYACFLKPDQFTIKLITILLKAKANPDIPDFRNNTPLFYMLAEHQAEHQAVHQTENQIGNQIGNQIENQTKNQVENQIENQTENQIGNQTENQIENQIENHFKNQNENPTETRSKNSSIKCSKTCSLRSPFIDLLIDFKCDRLNLDELDYGKICSLQQYCRKTIQNAIQKHSSKLRFHLLQNIKHQLPDSLCDYLSRRAF